MAINPLQPPINYAGMVPQVNIAQQFAEFGQVLVDRKKRIQAEEVKKVYATDLQAALANPTQETWSNMIAKYPQQREAFAEVRKQYGEVAVRNESNMGMEVSMALENNNPEVATAKLMKIISALENSGRPTGIYQQALNQLELGNTKGAQAAVNSGLAFLDPDNFKKIVDARTAAAKAPSEVTKAEGEAATAAAQGKVATGTVEADIAKAKALSDEALSKARVAIATAPDAISKAAAEKDLARAQADKAKVDAEFARQNTLADLDKKAADLRLTNEQKNQAIAMTNKLGQESAKAALELAALKASGGVDPAKKFEQEEKLRKEHQGRMKMYDQLGITYETMKTSAEAKNGPGDIALITGFMKMIDPDAIVRETDFSLARDTAGLFENLKNQAQKLQSGQIFALDSKQRQEYVTLAKQYLNAAQEKAVKDKKALGIVVKNYSLNPDNVFGPETVAPPAAGQRNVTVDY